ncbi:class I SAM-dependent methyltransferase [Roseomonas sp. OT10]|uniref:class I SAM-dependent methyltransferase n=1 Tax=Roseomonas cutis TaxID=2897332 RepID=UPI001E5114C0|nr:class I SAM-dependent methyltransferase [Roseomonas sp. OT10]UFN49753.1 class I SAM-dependent methyltransferase [Roseomonas sp. OT10]
MTAQSKLERESQFWDAKQTETGSLDPALYRVSASDRDDRSVPWLPYLGFREQVQTVLDHLGELKGRRVLDLGCGTGFLASLLAAQGAEVDALDISPASVAIARHRAEISGVADRIRFHVMPAEALGFPDASFDALCGAFVLHHLDLATAAPELRRVLRPGGRAAFIETCGHSALLMTARRMLPGRLGIEKASSDDEAPLASAAEALLRRSFGDSVRFHYPSTLMFRMLSYVPPLHKRPAQQLLSAVDATVHRLPFLRSQSYWGVVTLERPAADEPA